MTGCATPHQIGLNHLYTQTQSGDRTWRLVAAQRPARAALLAAASPLAPKPPPLLLPAALCISTCLPYAKLDVKVILSTIAVPCWFPPSCSCLSAAASEAASAKAQCLLAEPGTLPLKLLNSEQRNFTPSGLRFCSPHCLKPLLSHSDQLH